MSYIIYKVVNRINGKSYIGFTSRTITLRWKEHRNAAKRGAIQTLPCAIRKYGSDKFLVETLEAGEDSVFGKTIREPYWISVLPHEYNQTKGGDGLLGYNHTQATKDAISSNHKRRERLSAALQGNTNAKGSKHSEKQNLAKAERQRGKLLPLPQRQKMSDSQRRRKPLTLLQRQGMSKAQKLSWEKRRKRDYNV